MKNPINSKTYFKILNTIYYAQAFMPLAFAAVIGFMISNNQSGTGDISMWQYLVPAILILTLILAHFGFRMLLSRIPATLPLKEKMPKYARAVLIRSGLLEAPGLLAPIAAFITGEIYFLIVALIVPLIALMIRPTKNTIAQDLNLSPQERAMLDNPQAIISEADTAR